MKTIMVCTDGSEGARHATEMAVDWAARLGATVRAVYVTDVRLLEGPWLADLSGAIGAQPYAALVPQLTAWQREKASVILDAVRQCCAQRGVACDPVTETGRVIPTLLEQERHADLVVLGQRGEHAAWAWQPLGSCVEGLVRASIRPCLVVTEQWEPTRHALVAFDGSRESRKALERGLPLLQTLGASAEVVTVAVEGHSAPVSEEELREAVRQTAPTGMRVTTRVVRGPDAAVEILLAAEQSNAQLIVMGAYGHTRIRELILGSTTSSVLRRANMPVLLVRG
ncbi:MAG: universal stress protein [Verrucomicrobiae bacterium]|nr:universal stress protein [Verrucomicrobiae bacterium]MDW8343554.1 universal stress protein [Verrucomicrobiae bacterium]